MEFIVNEAGCQQLAEDMTANMREIIKIVSDIASQNSNLRAALGEDYESIAGSIRIMSSELESASSELSIIIRDMGEYMAKVQQARISLQD